MNIERKMTVDEEQKLQERIGFVLWDRMKGISYEDARRFRNGCFDALKGAFLEDVGDGKSGVVLGDDVVVLNEETRRGFEAAFVAARDENWISYLHLLDHTLVNYGEEVSLVETDAQMQELFDVLSVVSLEELQGEALASAMRRLELTEENKVQRVYGFTFNGCSGVVCFTSDWSFC